MTTRKQVAPAARGSASPSEDYYAARGIVRPNLRVRGDIWTLLEQESDRSGYSCSQLVEEMIRIELDPTHEGYVGPMKAPRCQSRPGYESCDSQAMPGKRMCQQCWLVSLDGA